MSTDARHCQHCGKQLERYQNGDYIQHVTAFRRQKFCSLECREEFNRGPETGDPTEAEIKQMTAAFRGSWGSRRLSKYEPAPVDLQIVYTDEMEMPE